MNTRNSIIITVKINFHKPHSEKIITSANKITLVNQPVTTMDSPWNNFKSKKVPSVKMKWFP